MWRCSQIAEPLNAWNQAFSHSLTLGYNVRLDGILLHAGRAGLFPFNPSHYPWSCELVQWCICLLYTSGCFQKRVPKKRKGRKNEIKPVSEGKVAVTDQIQECWYKSCLQSTTVKLQVPLLAFRKINVGRVSNPVSSRLYRQTCARSCGNTRCFNAAELGEEIHGIPEQVGLWFLRPHSSVRLRCALPVCTKRTWESVALLSQRLGLTAVFTKFCILSYNNLNLCTRCPSPFVRPMLCFCMNSYHINFWCFTFYSLPTDLLKNISVQRPQIQYMFCTDTGQNVLTNKYTACLLKQKLGCSVSLYLKAIEFTKSNRQQTDKTLVQEHFQWEGHRINNIWIVLLFWYWLGKKTIWTTKTDWCYPCVKYR